MHNNSITTYLVNLKGKILETIKARTGLVVSILQTPI